MNSFRIGCYTVGTLDQGPYMSSLHPSGFRSGPFCWVLLLSICPHCVYPEINPAHCLPSETLTWLTDPKITYATSTRISHHPSSGSIQHPSKIDEAMRGPGCVRMPGVGHPWAPLISATSRTVHAYGARCSSSSRREEPQESYTPCRDVPAYDDDAA